MEALQDSQNNSEYRHVVKQTLKDIYLRYESELKNLQEPVQSLIMKIMIHMSKEWNKQYDSLTQQIRKMERISQQIKEEAQKDHENLLNQIQRLTNELEQQGSRQNNLEDYLNASKSELQELKFSVFDVQKYRKELEEKLIDQSQKANNLEIYNEKLIEELQNEKIKNKRLEQQLQELNLNIKTLSMQYQYEFEKASKLSSNLSQKEEVLKELKEKIEERQYIQSMTHKQEDISKDQSEQSSTYNDRKFLNEEAPNLRCSQSQNPLYIPPQENFRSAQKKSVCNPKTKRTAEKHDLTSEKKIGKQSSKSSFPLKKPTTSSVKNSGNKVSIQINKKDRSEQFNIKDKLKDIFTDRVKYRIQYDLKYCHKLDSLRCKLRAKQIQFDRLNEEISGLKRQKKHERVSSMVLNSKSKTSSRKLSKQQINERWLQQDIKQQVSNPYLNTSYNDLTERHSEQQQTTPKKTQFNEQINSQNIDSSNFKRQDQLEQFYLSQQDFGHQHHLLNLQIDSKEDMSFKNLQFFNSLNNSNSLNCSSRLKKKRRQMSINSQDFQLIMYPNNVIQQEERCKFITSMECSPNVKEKNKFNRTTTQKQLTLALNQAKYNDKKIKPLNSERQQHILITSYLDTERKPANSVSNFQMFFQQSQNTKSQSVNTDFVVKKQENIIIQRQSNQKSINTQILQSEECGVSTEIQDTVSKQSQTVKIQVDSQMQTNKQPGISECFNTQINIKQLSTMLQEHKTFKDAQTSPQLIAKVNNQMQTQKNEVFKICQVANIIVERMQKQLKKRDFMIIKMHQETIFPSQKKQQLTLQLEQLPLKQKDKKIFEITQNICQIYIPQAKVSQETQIESNSKSLKIFQISNQTLVLAKNRNHQLISNLCQSCIKSSQKQEKSTQSMSTFQNCQQISLVSIHLKCQKALKESQIQTQSAIMIDQITQTERIETSVGETQTKTKQNANSQAQTTIISKTSISTQSMKPSLRTQKQIDFIFVPPQKSENLARIISSHSLSLSLDDGQKEDNSIFQSPAESEDEQWYSLYTKSQHDQQKEPQIIKESIVPKIKIKEIHKTFDKRKSHDYQIYIPDLHSIRTRSSSQDIISQREEIRQEPQPFVTISQQSEACISNYSPERSSRFQNELSPDMLNKTINEQSSICASHSHISSSTNRFDNLTVGKQSHINQENTCSQFSPERASKIVKDYKLTEQDLQILADYVYQYEKYHYLTSQDLATEQEQMVPFSVKQLRVLFCSSSKGQYKFALWKGKVLLISQNISIMELPSMQVRNVKTSNNQVIMGNCELTIANDKLSINRMGKIKFFQGQMIEGEWVIHHTKIFEFRSGK